MEGLWIKIRMLFLYKRYQVRHSNEDIMKAFGYRNHPGEKAGTGDICQLDLIKATCQVEQRLKETFES